jgi:hypothetical protein
MALSPVVLLVIDPNKTYQRGMAPGEVPVDTYGDPLQLDVLTTIITDELDSNKVLAPDGTGGVQWVAFDPVIEGDLDMDGHKLTGLAAGSGAGDSVRYEQVLLLAGGTMAGDILFDADDTYAIGNAGVSPKAPRDIYSWNVNTDEIYGITTTVVTCQANLSFYDTYHVTNMVDPTSPQDAATKAYADLMLPLAGGTMTGNLNLTSGLCLTWGGNDSNSISCLSGEMMLFSLGTWTPLLIYPDRVEINGTTLMMAGATIETATDSTGQIGTTDAAFLSAHVDTYYLGQSTTEYIAGGTAAVLVTAGGTEKLSVGAVITDKVGAAVPIVAKTADYLVTTSDHTILVDATSDDVDITLPDAADVAGRVVVIKRTDDSANVVRVVAQAGEDIDANQHYFLLDRWDSITVQSYGDNWYVIAQVEGSLEPSSSSSA